VRIRSSARLILTSERGFTIVEIMVVVFLLSALMAIAVFYSGSATDQISVFREQGVIMSAVYNARNLAVSTYGSPLNASAGTSGSKAPCGYGIAIPQGNNNLATSLSVFSYLPSGSGPCPIDAGTLINLATSSLPGQPSVSLNGVYVTANFDYLYFIPPDPRTCADILGIGVRCGDTNNPVGGSSLLPDLVVTITGRKNASVKACVVINGFGQITTTCP